MSDPQVAESPDATVVIGIDIGGTKILSGLVDRHGRVVADQRLETRSDHLLADAIVACEDLFGRAAALGRRVTGIGVGAKGAVDSRRRRLLGSLALGHGEIAMGDRLEATFEVPVRVENDVHAATIGEMVFGIGREVDDFLFYNAGTGIAIGIVSGGRLYRGASNMAGENGHAVIDATGLCACGCGMTGCIETMIIAARRDGGLMPLPGYTSDVSPADPAYGFLASSLSDAVALFDPAAVVLAGGMVNGTAAPWDWLVAEIEKYRGHSTDGRVPFVVPAFGGHEAGLLGAAALLLAPAQEAQWQRSGQT